MSCDESQYFYIFEFFQKHSFLIFFSSCLRDEHLLEFLNFNSRNLTCFNTKFLSKLKNIEDEVSAYDIAFDHMSKKNQVS